MALGKRRAVLQPLTGGMNYSTDIFSILVNQAQVIRNCHIDPNGRARTRKGSRKLNTTALSGKVTSIYDYKRPEGSGSSSILLVTAGTVLYKWDTETTEFVKITDLSTTDRPTWATFVTGGVSYAFMANGSDFFKYDGRVLSAVSTTYPWTSAPRYIIEYDDRLLAAGCDSDPYKVWVSGILDGEDWFSGTSTTSVSWSMKSSTGNRVTGLGLVYNYCAIFQERGVTIITESDPVSDTSQQIMVSTTDGTTSHWSIQTINNEIYFANSSRICKGQLRDAVENGLVVVPIDDNVYQKYSNISNPEDIVSAYDYANSEIQWGLNLKPYGVHQTTFVFNLGLSGKLSESPYVWSGIFDGSSYEPYTLAVVNVDGKPLVYRGDTSGYVYVMDESTQYKDNTTAIVTEIVSSVLNPYGNFMVKRARMFSPYLYQKYDSSSYIQYIVDGAFLLPSTGQYIVLQNNVPFWRAATNTVQTQTWNSTIWNDAPVVVTSVNLDSPFHYVQFILKNDGANDRDEMSFAGAELFYQVHQARKDY
jgi:hypothetical protein